MAPNAWEWDYKRGNIPRVWHFFKKTDTVGCEVTVVDVLHGTGCGRQDNYTVFEQLVYGQPAAVTGAGTCCR